MRCVGLAPWLGLAACGRLGFDDIGHQVGVGQHCTADTDCGLCEPCVGQVCAPPIQPTQLFLGHRSTCFLDGAGARWCVGTGVGPYPTNGFPEPLPDDTGGWTGLFLGWGVGYGWQNGQLQMFEAPTSMLWQASADSTLIDVSIVESNVCWRHAAGDANCNYTSLPGTWSSVLGGDDGTCGVQSDGSMWCFGPDYASDLGQGVQPDNTNIPAPARVGTANDWLQVENGHNVTCALKTDHTLWCMGGPTYAGTNGVDPMGAPIQISPDTDWTWVHARWAHACAGKADGRVFCWGSDGYGLDVVPGSANVPVPTQIPGFLFDQFLLGGHHYCATLLGGSPWYCWGWNGAGQLPDGDTNSLSQPTVPVCTPASP
jgi:hypothetical protein